MAKIRTIRGLGNRNQNSAAEARPLGSGSSASVGRQPSHAGRLGAGPQQTARTCSLNSPQHPRSHLGGQASLGLFGGTGRRHAEHAASRAVQAKAPAAPQGHDQPRFIGGLSFGQQPRPIGFAEEAAAEYEAHLAEVAEARSRQLDDEADCYACTFAGAGYTEHLMAMEG
jgi:hypothetical protein